MALTACGADEANDGSTAGPPSTAAPRSSGEPAPPGPSCEDGELDGRRFILCTAGDAEDQPLIVALHGRGSSAEEMRAATELDGLAAAEGLAVVYPLALDGGWGDDTFTTPTRPAGDEDVVALDALIARARNDRRVDDVGPVALVGFSNGASMALRYAAERPDGVRAVVSVAGQLPRDPAVRPSARVPLLEVYGSADPIRSFMTGIPEPPDRRPGGPTPTLSTPDTVAAFVAVGDGAVEEAHLGVTDPDTSDSTRLDVRRWTDGAGSLVELMTVVDGGHTWPSARALFTGSDGFGPTSRDLDATAAAIEFVLAADPDA
jgi:polyhydroxybutyrate depolymerase